MSKTRRSVINKTGTRWLVLVLAAICSGSFLYAGEPSHAKSLQCGLAKTPPKLDGILDDVCWAAAGKIDDFFVFMPVGLTVNPEYKTTVWVCADKEAIYIAFECKQPDEPKALADKRDSGKLWQTDDSAEIFISTGDNPKGFYQVIFNARGIFFDQDSGLPGVGAKWDGPVEAAATTTKDGWSGEVKIRLTACV